MQVQPRSITTTTQRQRRPVLLRFDIFLCITFPFLLLTSARLRRLQSYVEILLILELSPFLPFLESSHI
jgi:hypothetical protein